MEPIYSYFDKVLKGTMTRREFFQKVAAAGLATPVILSFLEGCAPQATATPTVPAGPVKLKKPTDVPKATKEAHPLVFNGWAWRVDIVEKHVAVFEQQYDEVVNYTTVAGDYPAIMTSKLMAGAPLDLCYANPAEAVRWYLAGWTSDFEAYWDIEEAKGRMYPNVLDSITYKGHILGLPYFHSASGTATNEILLEKAGLKGQYPKNFEELYKQLRDLKAMGIAETPYIPRWNPAWYGIPWGFVFECLNRGDQLFDDEFNPTFDTTTIAMQVLEDWRALYVDKLVPEAAVTMTEGDMFDAAASGAYVYWNAETYDVSSYNDPERSAIAGHSLMIPATEQAWGLLNEGIYVVPRKPRDETYEARAYRLGEFFGYKDKDGNLTVRKDWAICCALGTGYAEVWEDPEVVAAFKGWAPNDEIIGIMADLNAKAPFVKAWHAFWYNEWNTRLKDDLPLVILGEKDPTDAIREWRELATQLKETYKTA